MEKLIICRDLGGLKVTPESNYNGMQNEDKIVRCSEFPDAEAVRDFFCKYFGCKDEDFIDWSDY